ncbi:hypothetical protein IEU95_05180 [Hoyosella rhizosphaerae]|uniref:Uncharacterized protein n=1 Tax=Hoyosella rhizosphaerae TaxID=1755582 RepID=A0A916U6F4_9ACTN|nr:hypothetical protein [Hoyosella rhizosphaerae]MBN4926211.1 hypothetical protein [Hoyosella rhizosphaerae]GGC61193.1 hypothetical protein GCM10011410_12100 [Hoyosella rhizosphaerae]
MKRRLAVVASSAVMLAGVSLAAAPTASAHPGIGFHIYDTQQQCLQGLFEHVLAGQYRINCIGFLNTPYILFHY